MKFEGRELDPVLLWEQYVDFPPSITDGGFAPLVRCPNPEHNTEKRHFQVNLDKPLVHCFANCGISGTYTKAISLIEGINEREARRLILKRCAATLTTRSKRKRSAATQRGAGGTGRNDAVPVVSLDYERHIPAIGIEYLHSRGIDGGSIARWNLGWDQDDRRIVIPAADDHGTTRFLIKRAVRSQDWPKYLYWPEKEECGWGKTDVLFGACNLDMDMVASQGLVLVEGSVDTIWLHQNDTRNTTGILGSKLSQRQAAIISKVNPPRIYCLFDKDAAGLAALRSAYRLLRKYPLFVGMYPKGGATDPATLSRKEVGRVLENALSIVKFNQRLPETLKLRRETVRYG